MKKDTAQKAAKWWADQLRKGKPDIESKIKEPGLDPVLFNLALAYQDIEANRPHITPELIDEFELVLTELLSEKERHTFRVSFDYGPDDTLQEAAKRVGFCLDETTLAWKTSTWIHGEKVFLYTESGKVEL